MKLFAATFATSFFACVVLVPLVRRWMIRLDIVDHPDNHRKLHALPTPLGGGLAVLAAFLLAVVSALWFSTSQRAALLDDLPFLLAGTASAILICLVGLLDDRYQLRGRQKLIGQILAAGCWLLSGMWIEKFTLFGYTVELGVLAIPFTLFWLLGAINALNLLDGVDGLATSIGIVLSVSIAVIAAMTGHTTETFLALAMAGALAGFLVYNRPPASIFLGDGGSMLIGLVLGMLAIRSSLKGPATVALAVPTAVWAIPILDVSMAILRRKLTGRSIYATDRGHLHHLILQRGWTGWFAVLVIACLCGITCVAGIVGLYFRHEGVALGVVCGVVGIMAVTRLFGHHEFALAERHARQFLKSLLFFHRRYRAAPAATQTHLRGDRPWDELWETVLDFAERFELASVRLHVVMPAVGEEYHANWKRPATGNEEQLWRSEIPLHVRNVTVGRLILSGDARLGESVFLWMGDLLAGLKAFETQLAELVEDSWKGHAWTPAVGQVGSTSAVPDDLFDSVV